MAGTAVLGVKPYATAGVSSVFGTDAVSGSLVRMKMTGAVPLSAYGALTDGTDAAAALSAALASGKAVIIDGHYTLASRVTYSGPASILGYGRNFSSLTWGASAASVGIKISVDSQNDYIGVEGIGFYTAGTGGTAIELDYSAQVAGGGGNNVFQIESRGHVKACTVSGTTQLTTYFNKGIRIVQGLNVLVEDNYCLGGYTSPDTSTTLTASVGIEYIATDDNMVNAKIWKNQCLFFKKGCHTLNVEGLYIEGNDFQANYDALHVENNDRVRNQVRIINNHLGGHSNSITLDAVQFFQIIGNEIFLSTAITSNCTLVLLKDISGGKIIGNTLRRGGGNPATYPALGISIVREDMIANCFEVNIDNNQFYDVKDGVSHDPTNSVSCRVGDGNIFHNMTGTRQVMNGNVQAYHRGIIGDGTLAHPSGSSSLLTVSKRTGAGIALNRDGGDGAVATFHGDLAAQCGSISIASSGTATAFNTSSDELLKIEDGEFTFEEAREIIDLWTFYNFRWRATGKSDHGVFAQRIYQVYPKAVTVGGWVKSAGGEPCKEWEDGAIYVPWSVDYSKLMTPVARALQGALKRQDEFEERLSALESSLD